MSIQEIILPYGRQLEYIKGLQMLRLVFRGVISDDAVACQGYMDGGGT